MRSSEKIILMSSIFLIIFLLLKQTGDMGGHQNSLKLAMNKQHKSLIEEINQIKLSSAAPAPVKEKKCTLSNKQKFTMEAYKIGQITRNKVTNKANTVNSLKSAKKAIWSISDSEKKKQKEIRALMSPIDGLIKKVNSGKDISNSNDLLKKFDKIIKEL